MSDHDLHAALVRVGVTLGARRYTGQGPTDAAHEFATAAAAVIDIIRPPSAETIGVGSATGPVRPDLVGSGRRDIALMHPAVVDAGHAYVRVRRDEGPRQLVTSDVDEILNRAVNALLYDTEVRQHAIDMIAGALDRQLRVAARRGRPVGTGDVHPRELAAHALNALLGGRP